MTSERQASALGILAAGGDLPLDLARSARRRGRAVHIVALAGIASEAIEAFPHDWCSLGQLNRMLGAFRRAGCREIAISGAMQRPDLLRQRVDFGFIRHLPTVLRLTQGGDDSVLRRVVRFFESQGFTVVGVGDIAPDLLAPRGQIGHVAPAPDSARACERGTRLMSRLGDFDIGQAIVARADRVVAIEGVTGTDAMLRDLAQERSGRATVDGAVLVKLAKPGQELRVDLPTIGPVTIERAAAAGIGTIAVSAGAAIIMHRERTIAAADAAGIAVVGLEHIARDAARLPLTGHALPTGVPSPLGVLSKRAPTPGERRDIAVARDLIGVLADERAGRAAVVAGEHVLAVDADVSLARILAPLGERRHWGLRAFRRRIGLLALDMRERPPATNGSGADTPLALDAALFSAARDAGLAGLVCFGGRFDDAARRDVVAWANDAQVFLMADSDGISP